MSDNPINDILGDDMAQYRAAKQQLLREATAAGEVLGAVEALVALLEAYPNAHRTAEGRLLGRLDVVCAAFREYRAVLLAARTPPTSKQSLTVAPTRADR